MTDQGSAESPQVGRGPTDSAESPAPCDIVPHSMGGDLTWCRTHLRLGSECEAMPTSAATCVRCGNDLGPDDFFEDGETRPHIIHDSDEPTEWTEGPLCMRDFRIGVGLGVWHECPTCGGRGKVREPGT